MLLVKLFVKDYDNVTNTRVRESYGTLAGIVGIILNIVLTIIKFVAGTITGSIAITSDAINNLSDAGSSIVTLVGFRVSNKPADKDHPFGHGRLEYISALIVSFIIMLLGFELLKASVEKVRTPDNIEFSFVALGIMLFSIFAKLWLAFFNRKLGKRINSAAMKAVVFDSLSDIAATSSTVIALVVSKFSSVPIDGIMGIIVSCFIFWSGIKVLKETLGLLLGKPPEEEFVNEIENKILSYDGVVGVHDLIVHDYGPSRCFASAHAEVPSNIDIMVSHDIIDNIERDIYTELGLLLVIHMDPVVVDDEHIKKLKDETAAIVKAIDETFSIHDFRVVDGPSHTNLIFDVVVPRNHQYDNAEIQRLISDALKEINERYFAVITVEHSFN